MAADGGVGQALVQAGGDVRLERQGSKHAGELVWDVGGRSKSGVKVQEGYANFAVAVLFAGAGMPGLPNHVGSRSSPPTRSHG